MSKNVSRDRVNDLNEKLSSLQKVKMQENDLEHFKRFEKFIEQENLSDQRFSINCRYNLYIPEEYIVVNNAKKYADFLEKWNPKERNGIEIDPRTEHFSDSDFAEQEGLLSGKNYEVIEYVVKNYGQVPYTDCLKFLCNEKVRLCGLQLIITLLDLDKDKVSFQSGEVLSVSSVDQRLYYVSRSVADMRIGRTLKFVDGNYIPEGKVFLTLNLQEKK